MGTPTVFLRLATCNLACSWCDTKYTWDWKHYNFNQEVTSLEPGEIEELVLGFECKHLVVTGGEPLLQQQSLAPLLASLSCRGFTIEVETNGTILPRPDLIRAVDQWNVSPKLANSGNSARQREHSKVLSLFNTQPSVFFKFVVVGSRDITEIRELCERYGLPRDRVVVMPEGTTAEVLRERSKWIAEACTREGFRFSTRLHIMLWGDQRAR